MGAATFDGLPPGMSESDLVGLLGSPHEMHVRLGDFEAGNVGNLKPREQIGLVSEALAGQYGGEFSPVSGERTLIHNDKLCVHSTLDFMSRGSGPVIRAYDISAHGGGPIIWLTTYEETYPGLVPIGLRQRLLGLGLRDERIKGLMTM